MKICQQCGFLGKFEALRMEKRAFAVSAGPPQLELHEGDVLQNKQALNNCEAILISQSMKCPNCNALSEETVDGIPDLKTDKGRYYLDRCSIEGVRIIAVDANGMDKIKSGMHAFNREWEMKAQAASNHPKIWVPQMDNTVREEHSHAKPIEPAKPVEDAGELYSGGLTINAPDGVHRVKVVDGMIVSVGPMNKPATGFVKAMEQEINNPQSPMIVPGSVNMVVPPGMPPAIQNLMNSVAQGLANMPNEQAMHGCNDQGHHPDCENHPNNQKNGVPFHEAGIYGQMPNGYEPSDEPFLLMDERDPDHRKLMYCVELKSVSMGSILSTSIPFIHYRRDNPMRIVAGDLPKIKQTTNIFVPFKSEDVDQWLSQSSLNTKK